MRVLLSIIVSSVGITAAMKAVRSDKVVLAEENYITTFYSVYLPDPKYTQEILTNSPNLGKGKIPANYTPGRFSVEYPPIILNQATISITGIFLKIT